MSRGGSLSRCAAALAAGVLSAVVTAGLSGCAGETAAPPANDAGPVSSEGPAETEPADEAAPAEPAPAETSAEAPAASDAPASDQLARAPAASAETASAGQPGSGAVKLDPKLPEYKATSGVSGTLKSVGSDSMNNLMTYWAEGFRKFYPGVRIEIEGKGSSTAPPALIAGTAQFGPMSRDMKDAEVAQFKQKFGYEPALLRTGIDLLAVYVNKNNPVESLTLPQVDAIFSQTRRLGHEDVTSWGQVGAEGRLASLPISLYGRNAASGTYGFFKEKVLQDGDYKPSVKEQPGSSAVVQGVAGDDAGIGYSGIGYRTAGVKPLAIAKDEGGEPVEPSEENVYNNKYPLFRFLNVYVNARPNAQMDPVRREFIRYVFSRQGQEVVVKDGYYPLPANLAAKELEKVGIKVDPAK